MKKQKDEFDETVIKLQEGIITPIGLGLNTSHIEIKRNVSALLFVS